MAYDSLLTTSLLQVVKVLLQVNFSTKVRSHGATSRRDMLRGHVAGTYRGEKFHRVS